MATAQNERKTDCRDAEKIAKCLAYGTYSPVHVPTQGDEETLICDCCSPNPLDA